jgi:hypothetical protein
LTRKRPDRVMVTAPVLPRTWSHGVPGELELPPGTAHSYRLRTVSEVRFFTRARFSRKPKCGSRFKTCSEALQGFQERTGNHPSGAKAQVDLVAVVARLKSCPFKTTSSMAVAAIAGRVKSCPFKTTSTIADSGKLPWPIAESSALRSAIPPQVSQVKKMKRGLYV